MYVKKNLRKNLCKKMYVKNLRKKNLRKKVHKKMYVKKCT